MRSLELSLGSLYLKIPECQITQIEPFVPIQFASVEYSTVGVAVVKGRQYEPRHTWQLTALLLEPEMNRLRGMYYRSDWMRRNFVREPGIVLIDKIHRFIEDAPRTRAIAPGTTEIVDNGLVEYYAIYSVFLSNLKTPKQGRYYATTFDMVEVEKVLA